MATIIDKLLNRDTEAKPSAEELRQIANLAHAESERLAALVDQAQSSSVRGSVTGPCVLMR